MKHDVLGFHTNETDALICLILNMTRKPQCTGRCQKISHGYPTSVGKVCNASHFVDATFFHDVISG